MPKESPNYDGEVMISQGAEGYYFARGKGFQAFSFCSGGRVKGHGNEDAAYFDVKRMVVAVADGMGGNDYGDEASAIVISTVRWAVHAQLPSISITAESVGVLREKFGNHKKNPGSTLSMGRLIKRGRRKFVKCVTVGDSPIFVIHPKKGLLYRSKDQSVVQDLIDNGSLNDPVQSYVHMLSSALTNAIGVGMVKRDPCEKLVPVTRGCYILAVTDGISGFLSDEEVVEAVLTHGVNAPNELRALAEGRYYIDGGFIMRLEGQDRHVNLNHGDNISASMMVVP